jgi:hypothetical protein
MARAIQVSRLLRPRPFPLDIVVRTPQETQERLASGDYFIREVLERCTSEEKSYDRTQ